MNPIALRLSAISLTLEGCGMPEIVEALQIAEREIIRLEALIPPKPERLVMVCGVDCKPGDATCNNYCNMAPQKGPMAAAPPPGPDALLIVVCAECGMRHWADTTVPVCLLCEKPINGPLVPATEGEKAARARAALRTAPELQIKGNEFGNFFRKLADDEEARKDIDREQSDTE